MADWKSYSRLVIITIACMMGISSCKSFPLRQEPELPQLPYAHERQEALDQALPSGQNHPELGISAALIVPGYRTWTGVAGNSHPGVPFTTDMISNAGSIEKNFQAALYLPDSRTSIVWLINTGESPPELANQIMNDSALSLFEVLNTN